MIRRLRDSRPLSSGRLFLALILLVWTGLVFGHGGDDEGKPAVEAVLDPLPAELDGVQVQLRRTLAPQLLVANPTDRELTILDNNGRAFLRIGPGETQADLNAAEFHRTNTLMAPGAISADSSSEARWQTVEPEPHWGWFDLRLRTETIAVPHEVVARGKRATVSSWSIPVRLGDQKASISGKFEFAPEPGGIPEARVADTGALGQVALVRAMNGSARSGLFLSYRGDEPMIVYGMADEPMLRFDSTGVSVNRHSPTWKDIAPSGAPPYEAGENTDWAQVSPQSSYGWIDPRAGFTGTVESADEASVIKKWAIPVTIGGSESTIEGVTEWKPVMPANASTATSTPTASAPSNASDGASKTATLHRITTAGDAEEIGTITFTASEYGVLVTPDLRGVQSQGAHGTHIHEQPNCGPKMVDGKAVAGAAAGGHYDPGNTGQHAGPYAEGHLGDLPNLIVEANGTSTIPVLAPRLKISDLNGWAVMMHAAPDHYANHGHHHHGKGGMRMYCGVIQ